MLTLRDVTKTFNARTLFTGANMTVNYAERVALVGPNGAGKSTLFSLILKEDEPDAGEVLRDEWTTLGYLPQESEPVGEETILDVATGKAGLIEELEKILRDYESRSDVAAPEYNEAHAKHDALNDPQAIACDGYVCGVELFSKRGDLKIALDGRPFEVAPAGPERYRYTFFPKIRGDALCAGDGFDIQIQTEAARRDLTVRHQGARLLSPDRQPADSLDAPPVFRLLGQSPERFRARGRDFAERLAAVTDGIGYVQKRFGARLVEHVDILAVGAGDNALTLRGRRQIWFYAETFWGESIPELRVMAEHEALHLAVDEVGLTGRTAIRAFFAELSGYDLLSLERFTLVASGRLTARANRPTSAASPLLAFIDERNYFPGMTGGHAADNLDEFCTSLLHTLLYADHLETNLQRRVSARERTRISQDLARTLDLFAGEIADFGTQHGPPRPLNHAAADLFRAATQIATRLSPVVLDDTVPTAPSSSDL